MLWNYKKEMRKELMNTVLGNFHSIPLDKIIDWAENQTVFDKIRENIEQNDIPRFHSLLFSKSVVEALFEIKKEKLWNSLNNINKEQDYYSWRRPKVVVDFSKRKENPKYRAYFVSQDELKEGHEVNKRLKRYTNWCILNGARYDRKWLILERKDIKTSDDKSFEFQYNTSLLAVGFQECENSYEVESITGRLNHSIQRTTRVPDRYLSNEELNDILLDSDYDIEKNPSEIVLDNGETNRLNDLYLTNFFHFVDVINNYKEWKNSLYKEQTNGWVCNKYYGGPEVLRLVNVNDEWEFIKGLVDTSVNKKEWDRAWCHKILEGSNKNKFLLMLWRNKDFYKQIISANKMYLINHEPFKQEHLKEEAKRIEAEQKREANKQVLLNRINKIKDINIIKNKTTLLNGLKHGVLNIDEIKLGFELKNGDLPYIHEIKLSNNHNFINNNLDNLPEWMCCRSDVGRTYKREKLLRDGTLQDIFGKEFTQHHYDLMERVVDRVGFFATKKEYGDLRYLRMSEITFKDFKRYLELKKIYEQYDDISSAWWGIFDEYKEYKARRYLMVIPKLGTE